MPGVPGAWVARVLSGSRVVRLGRSGNGRRAGDGLRVAGAKGGCGAGRQGPGGCAGPAMRSAHGGPGQGAPPPAFASGAEEDL